MPKQRKKIFLGPPDNFEGGLKFGAPLKPPISKYFLSQLFLVQFSEIKYQWKDKTWHFLVKLKFLQKIIFVTPKLGFETLKVKLKQELHFFSKNFFDQKMCHGFLYNILKNQPGTPVTLAVNAKKLLWNGYFLQGK